MYVYKAPGQKSTVLSVFVEGRIGSNGTLVPKIDFEFEVKVTQRRL